MQPSFFIIPYRRERVVHLLLYRRERVAQNNDPCPCLCRVFVDTMMSLTLSFVGCWHNDEPHPSLLDSVRYGGANKGNFWSWSRLALGAAEKCLGASAGTCSWEDAPETTGCITFSRRWCHSLARYMSSFIFIAMWRSFQPCTYAAIVMQNLTCNRNWIKVASLQLVASLIHALVLSCLCSTMDQTAFKILVRSLR